MKDTLTKIIIWVLVERPASWRSYDELAQGLERSSQSLNERFFKASASEVNAAKLRHIIAIERWGQSRLNIALGAQYKQDTNHDYEPEHDLSWQALQELFKETRAQTISIAKALKGVAAIKVPHNQFGELSLKGWLRYLGFHASTEAKSIKA